MIVCKRNHIYSGSDPLTEAGLTIVILAWMYIVSLEGLLMVLPEGAESLQNNIAQLCESW